VKGGGATSSLWGVWRGQLVKGIRGIAQAAAAVDSEEQKRQRVPGPKWKTGKHMCDSGQQRGGARGRTEARTAWSNAEDLT
jgi:hypothetical protein